MLFLVYLSLFYLFIVCLFIDVRFNRRKSAILEHIAEELDILQLPTICEYCNAKQFAHETKTLCCCDGEISLIMNDVPQQLYDLC